MHELTQAPIKAEDQELSIALLANHYLHNEQQNQKQIETLTQWCTQALATDDGKQYVKNWVSFHLPKRTEYENLVPTETTEDQPPRLTYSDDQLRLRDGFKLTDPRMAPRDVQDEVNYCIYCHDHDGDFCSKGFPVKKGDPTQGFKKNPLDLTLAGCPLEEKISEMNYLKRDGYTLAALAMIMVDNPMCPATGHRICNDCMKACIYQKQDPVNIPQIETRILVDVLDLPWGVEIYDLLTRWNPLRQHQYVTKQYNGLKVLIAGMGPAGFTLAHHLLLEGFAVVGFDGLKIEPLPEKWIQHPIYDYQSLNEELDSRIMSGFGGVAEYGITVRWDKNFLKLIYISLSRRPYFQVFGSTRFGGTITINDAWDMGFDHFAIAVGAGLPKALPIPGSLAPGMRQANDFLMALQLGNAAKKESLTNIQVRLPAVVIGGGLTGVDTATEVQAYYITQVEKTLSRHETLLSAYGEAHLHDELDHESQVILAEFLAHGKAVRLEREKAQQENRQPNFIQLIRSWGGVTIVYRKKMQASPAYINNHEELHKAFEEGIYYLEQLEPSAVILNDAGHCETLRCKKHHEDTLVDLAARSIFVATGTQPNIAYEFEHKGTFTKHDHRYQTYENIDNELVIAHGVEHCKDTQFGPFTSYKKEAHRVSLIGDTHPVFHGNVVKAIASGYRTYPKITALFKNRLDHFGSQEEYHHFAKKIQAQFTTTLVNMTRHSPDVLELEIHAPQAVKHYQPGQFYRLQNYEMTAQNIESTLLQTEPLALIVSGIDRQKNTIKFIIIEKGASSKLCATFHLGEALSLMGPTGVRAKVSAEHETILIMGNQLSIATLCSYGEALKASGNRIIYAGHYQNKDGLFLRDQIEAIADVILWSVEEGDPITPNRPQDHSIQGDAIHHLHQYGLGKLTPHPAPPTISLHDIDRVYVIGNTSLLRAFQKARGQEFSAFFVKNPSVYGSVYSSMQCMLKGVCAQCLQWQIDPETGRRTKAVFACSWHEQPLELIDIDNIDERQSQNRLQEKLSDKWIDYLFNTHTLKKI